MTKRWKLFVILLALMPAKAFAQPTVFFDDFDGNALLPHWTPHQFPPLWEYNVSNSMLNVTALNYPSNPNTPYNLAFMNTQLSPQYDFQIDAFFGWEAGSSPHGIYLSLSGGPGTDPPVAAFGYMNGTWASPDPVIWTSATYPGLINQSVIAPAPQPGIHHFRISRTGTQLSFFLNGEPFATFAGTTGHAVTHLGFQFIGPNAGIYGTLHIDRIQVVPLPGGIALLAGFSLLSIGKPKRARVLR